MKLDTNFVRSQFPAFNEPSLDGWSFFENAGGSYACKQVINRLTEYYTKTKLQPDYEFPASRVATAKMEEGYQRLSEYLNVKNEEISFGPSTSQNTYVLANALRPMWKDGDEIIVSCQDHEANAGVWRRLEPTGIVVKEWHVDPESGLLSLDKLDELITDKTKLIAFPHCSNIIAHVNPVKEITEKAHKVGAISLVDAVSYASHGFPDLQELGVDIYLFSLYKTYGPHLGLMFAKKELRKKVANQSHFFNKGKLRLALMPSGEDHAQIAAAAGIAEYFDAVYAHHFNNEADSATKARALFKLFHEHEETLLAPLLTFLKSRDDVRILGPDDHTVRAPTVSIIPLNITTTELATKLEEQKIMVGCGHFYGVRPLMDMDIPLDSGAVRLSFVHYTTMEEIEHLISGLKIALD